IRQRAVAMLGMLALVVAIFTVAEVTRRLSRALYPASNRSAGRDVALAVDPATFLAVLPLISANTPLETESLAEGTADTIINQITALDLPQVKVIGLQSALPYEQAADPIASASDGLHARFVATVSISRRGRELSVSAALDDAKDRSRIWGKVYNGPRTEI